MLDTLFTLILFIFAGLIAIGLLFKKNMWSLICAYWITQFIRYATTLVSNL